MTWLTYNIREVGPRKRVVHLLIFLQEGHYDKHWKNEVE